MITVSAHHYLRYFSNMERKTGFIPCSAAGLLLWLWERLSSSCILNPYVKMRGETCFMDVESMKSSKRHEILTYSKDETVDVSYTSN